jgi:hypothetical protein
MSAFSLAQCLTSCSGARVTPIMDHCFGAGKTSLVYKFRMVLGAASASTSLRSRISTLDQLMYTRLNASVYLHIPFRPALKNCDYTRLPEFCQSYVLESIGAVLEQSLRKGVPKFSDTNSLKHFLLSLDPVIFLFHFDDVGAFEMPSSGLGVQMLCTLWTLAEELRLAGHFYVLTGRSAYLHLLGKSNMMFEGRPAGFQSPNPMRMISLDLLSKEAIQQIFARRPDARAREFAKVEGNIESVLTLTGGIPRAVVTLLEYFSAASDQHFSLDDPILQEYLVGACSKPHQSATDATSFRLLAELSWGGIDFDLNTAVLSGEMLSSVVARLGGYTTTSDSPSRSRIVVPLFQIRGYSWSPRSLRSISEYENPGGRLETGFRRVLHLRLTYNSRSWSSIALPFLESAGVPFPAEPLKDSFPFPKISSKVGEKRGGVADFMKKVHEGRPDVKNQVFPVSSLGELCSEARIGQYYQFLPLSKSADALIRCDERTVCHFQFKNLAAPISVNAAVTEAAKCELRGWKSFLVIICTAGYEGDKGEDCIKDARDVQIILLSRRSVAAFLGANTLSTLAQDQVCTLLSDLQKRLAFKAA